MKLDFPSSSGVIFIHLFHPENSKGMDETQLPFELKVSFIHGMDETQLTFELKVSFIHLLHPENSKGNG